MRSWPSSWTRTLAKLGFRREVRKMSKRSHHGRKSRLESLEQRQMLTVTVNTLIDKVDAGDGVTSLREAIAHPTDHSVTFDASLNGGRIVLTEGPLAIAKSITISGPGADKLTIDAAGQNRVMSFGGGTTSSISGLTITGGNAIGGGGGIYTHGNLTLIQVDVSGNVTNSAGGGVYVQHGGKLHVYSSVIHNNRSGERGGGIEANLDAADSLQIYSSTISNNTSVNGGGVFVFTSGGTMPGALISRTTISGNTAVGWAGGGIYNANGAVASHGSIIAGNAAPNGVEYSDAIGVINGDHNLIGRPGNTGLGNSPGNRVGTTAVPLDPRLSPLGNHGGPTKTHVPLPGSPALDANGASGAPQLDQRGYLRVVEQPEANVSTAEDIGAVELSERVGPAADYNGDGRSDLLLFDPVNRSLNLAVGSATADKYDLEYWNVLTNDVFTTSIFIAGDFNGDGRDDLVIRTASAYHVGISDGATFVFYTNPGLPGAWHELNVGDVDGDGDHELISWNGANWQVAHYDEHAGNFRLEANVAGNLFREAGTQRFFADANNDGRADLIRLNGAGEWGVALSQPVAGGMQFVHQPTWSTSWFNGYYSSATGLDAAGPIKRVIEEFEWVYNNVELELYPGLMKGPEATEQTKAGNDWDQAALLVERLQALPFLNATDVQIVSGTVRSDSSTQFRELCDWLGVDTAEAAFHVIRASLDGNAIPRDANGGNSLVTGNPFVAIEFSHAWVRVKVPTGSGLGWIDLDPSWKFKDRQAGILLPADFDNVRSERGVFDEISYLALDPSEDRRLPVEYFEDQVMQWMAAQMAYQGSSLADLPYDGPILTRSFQQLPAGLGAGIAVLAPANVATYEDFAAIVGNAAAKQSLTHRVVMRLKNSSNQYWSQELVVPVHSLDSIQISFASSSSAANDPNSFAPANSSTFYSRLVVGGAIVPGTTGYSFSSSSTVTIEVEHLAPEGLVAVTSLPTNDPDYVGPTINDRKQTYSRAPGKIMALSLDANQHSRDSLTALQGQLLAAVASGGTESTLRQAIDDLTAYAGAKYWEDFNRYNRIVAGLTHSISVKGWVGSGIVTADPTLLLDSDPEGSNDVLIEYLPYGIAPANFGVDLPNGVNSFYDATTGFSHHEAWQLAFYNGSALEHNIVEEVISSESVSTIKGLQRAMQRDLGLNANGVLINFDSIEEFTSSIVDDVRVYTHVARWYVNPTTQAITRVNINIPFTSGDYLVQTSTAPLRSHTGNTNLGQSLWIDFFTKLEEADGNVSVLVPFGRTQLNYEEDDNWIGAVYLAETQRSISLAIVPDGGQAANGGYSGNVTTAPPKQLAPGNFLNAGWAGDPVNVANGNMFRDETDIVFPNAGVPLTFTRHYDSQSKDDIGLGVGWTYSFGDLLYFDPKDPSDPQDADAIVWLDAAGRRHRFEKLSDGTYRTPSGLTGKFTAISGVAINSGVIGFTFQDSTGMEYKFDKLDDPLDGIADSANLMRHADGSSVVIMGRLKEQVDHNGDGIAIKYTANAGRTIEHVRDVHTTVASPTRRLAFTNASGVITAVSKYDAGGLVGAWDFGYVPAGIAVPGIPSTKRLNSVEAPAVLVANASYVNANARPKVQYRYNNVANHYAKGLIDKITEPDGSWHAYEYYFNGRTFRVLQGEASESLPTPPAPTVDLSGFTGVGNTSAPNNYGVVGAVIGGTFDARRSGSGEAAAYLADTTLDVLGGVLTRNTAGGFGATGTLTFDASSNNATPVDPYFMFGFFDKDNLAAGVFGFVIGDVAGSLTQFRFISVAGTSPSAADVISNGTYTFDLDVNNGQSGTGWVRLRLFQNSTVVMDESVAIGTTSLQADSFGFAQQYIGADSDATFEFSVSNVRYMGETLVQPNAPEIPEAIDIQSFTYNIFRGQTEFTDERGNTETYSHQKNGLLEKQIHADRTRQQYTWGAIDSPEEFLMTSMTDERGAVETFTYYGGTDPAFKHGQLKTSTAKHFTSQSPLVTTYDYIQPANKPRMALLASTIVDAGGANIKTTLAYDADGKLTSTADAEAHDAAGNVIGARATTRTYFETNDYRHGLLKSEKHPAIVDANGNAVVYETEYDYDVAGNIKSAKVKNFATQAVLAHSQFVYDALGNVIQSIDPAGVVTENVYDILGRLRETGFGDANAAINPHDHFTSRFKYDAMGRVRESIDALGRVTRFEYDRQGKVTKQINPDGTELLHEYDALGNCIAKTNGLGRTTRFVYDSRNRPIQTIHPDGSSERVHYDGVGNILEQIDELGSITTFKYDAAGRLLETTQPDPDGLNNEDGGSPVTTNKYDKLGNRIETIDPKGASTQFKHDKLGRIVETYVLNDVAGNRTSSNRTPLPGDKTLVSLATTDYDAMGNVVRTAVYDVSQYNAAATATLLSNPRLAIDTANMLNNFVQVMSTRYDAFGRPVKAIEAEGTTIETSARTEYDAAGRVRFHYDELKRATEYQYDPFGRLVTTKLADPLTGCITASSPTITYRYDEAGNRIAMVDPRGFTTRFEYDAFNRLIATTDAQGGRSSSLYDAAGQMVASVDALGRVAYTLYDERGRAKQKRGADPDGANAGVAPVTRYRYDAAGRVEEMIDPLGNLTTYRHDRLGRLTSRQTVMAYVVDDGDAGFAPYDADDTHVRTASAVDFGGDVTRVTSSSGNMYPQALWRFTDIPSGTYRVAATWTANPSTGGSWVAVGVNVDGVNYPMNEFGVNQQVAPDQLWYAEDIARHEEGQLRPWAQIIDALAIGSPTDGAVHTFTLSLTAPVGKTLQADAVRLERIDATTYEYDASGNLLLEADPLGRLTNYTYDELNRRLTETLPDPDGGGANPRPLTTTAYDGYGNVSSITENRRGGAFARKTEYQYDHRNRRTRTTYDADQGLGQAYINRATEYHYDAVGNLLSQIELPDEALERRTSYHYDSLNRLIAEIHNDDASFSTINPAGERMLVNTYDQSGNLVRVQRDPINNPSAPETLYRYDALGRVIEETAQGLVNGLPQQRTSRFQYDAVGNQTASIDPLLRMSRTQYDRLNRTIKVVAPDPDGAGPEVATHIEYVYDAAGRMIAETNSAGESEQFAYDSSSRLIRSTDGLGDATLRQYDSAGNLVKLTDPAGNSTTYAYDALGRIRFETTASGTHEFRYDQNGNLVMEIDRSGRVKSLLFNREDRVHQELWYRDVATSQLSGGTQWSDDIDTFYDDLGRVAEVQRRHRKLVNNAYTFDYWQTDSTAYDGLDRMVETSNQSLHNTFHSTAPAARQTYSYSFDAGGLVQTREQYVGGQFAARTVSRYNAFGELVKVEDRDTNAAGVPSTILDFDGTDAAFDYWADGAVKWASRYSDWDAGLNGHRNEVRTNYSYDGAGRVGSITHQQQRRTSTAWPGYQQTVGFGYGYDRAGRIDEQSTNWNSTIPAFSTRTNELQTFTYDAAGQVLTASSNLSNQSSSYGYTDNGNRGVAVEPVSGIDFYSIESQNRIEWDSNYRYEYDAEGNLTLRVEQVSDGLGGMVDGNRTEYVWDHRNRLVQVTGRKPSGTLTSDVVYRYNANDQVIYQDLALNILNGSVISRGVRHFFQTEGQRELTLDSAGAVVGRTIEGPTGEVLFDQSFLAPGQETLVVPLGDHQHSTRAVIDGGDLTIRRSIDYAPFGRVTAIRDESGALKEDAPGVPELSALITRFTHHGSYFEISTGLQQKGHRWYSPDVGRFLSEDPLGYDGGDSNLYRFGGNDPVNYADPSGTTQAGHPLSRQTNDSFRNSVYTALSQTAAVPTTTFGGFVGAGLGNQILGSGIGTTPAAAPATYNVASFYGPTSVAPAARPSITDFNASLSRSNNAASLTQTDSLTPSRVSTQTSVLFPVPDGFPRVRFQDSYSGKSYDYAIYEGRRYVLDPTGAATGLNLNVYEGTGTYYQAVPGWNSVSQISEPTSGQLARQAIELGAAVKLPGLRQSRTIDPPNSTTFRSVDDSGIDLTTYAPSTVQRTNAQLISDIATRAEAKIGGTGRLAGIDKHTYATRVLDRYQDMFGHRGLQTEVSVIGGKEFPYGTAGSVRLDVIDGPVGNPSAVYDYKFGRAGLTPGRINHIQKVTDYGPSTFIIEVRP